MADIQKQELTSLDIKQAQLQKLKELFPEAFTEGLKVDWDKLRLTLGSDTVDTGKERYGMNWPGKADCFKTIQQPSIATLVPAREESIDFDTTQNLFIEGDNLEVLKLLQKSYLGKIKMIYIDPPYNTGNEFIYPDNYSETLDTYLEYTGQIDGQGRKFATNTETDGRFHSKWMNMMYPRLFLAKNLLKEDGLLFISIDDHEMTNLRIICNEIFGEENFIAQIVWQKKTSPDARTVISAAHDYILLFAKNVETIKRSIKHLPLDDERKADYSNPDNDERGDWASVDLTGQVGRAPKSQFYTIKSPSGNEFPPPEGRCWALAEKTFYDLLDDNRIWFGKDGNSRPRLKKFLSDVEGMRPWTWWDNRTVGHNQEGNQEVKKLFNNELVFDNPKPTRLIKRILDICTSDSDIILDFFGGSGSTAHAIIEKNIEDGSDRRFIIVQLPEILKDDVGSFKAFANAKKLGYRTIAEVSKERVRKVISESKKKLAISKTKSEGELFTNNGEKQKIDLGFKVYKLAPSNFKVWDATLEKEPEAIQQRLFEHINHISPGAQQEAILYELLLKSGFELTTPIETLSLAGKTVFSIAEGQLLICLEKELTHDCVKAMAEKQPSRVICLDEAFTGTNADALKTNAVQIMKSKGVINFRTV
ncbi:MAG TPA: site-specific DNA-methyltransferase [Niabella sp.]|nr:site-specific DNA-methyltransferase [Niabella sp.]HUN01500.1 site-specific DNA-methyltransferase [Niabella sp.]